MSVPSSIDTTMATIRLCLSRAGRHTAVGAAWIDQLVKAPLVKAAAPSTHRGKSSGLTVCPLCERAAFAGGANSRRTLRRAL